MSPSLFGNLVRDKSVARRKSPPPSTHSPGVWHARLSEQGDRRAGVEWGRRRVAQHSRPRPPMDLPQNSCKQPRSGVGVGLSDGLSHCLSPEVPLGLARHAASDRWRLQSRVEERRGEEGEGGNLCRGSFCPSRARRCSGWVIHSKRDCDCEEFPPTFFLTNFASFFPFSSPIFGSLPHSLARSLPSPVGFRH